MDRFLTALLAGLVGGVAGSLAVHYLVEKPADVRSSETDARLDRLRDAIQESRAQVGGPPSSGSPAPAAGLQTGGGAPTLGPLLAPGSPPPAGGSLATGASASDLEALVARAAERAAEAVLEKQAAKAEAEKPQPKKAASLAEVAHEMGLTGAQETEIREAYREATDRALKILAEPDGDTEAIRKELAEAKGNEGKRTAMMMKYVPKFLPKIGEFMVIQSDRDARIHKALGSDENVDKYEKYQVAEEDPFGFGGSRVSVGRTIR